MAPELDWFGILSNIGIGGVLVWYLYYTTSVLWPKIHDQQSSAIREIVSEFRADLREERQLRIAMHSDLQQLLIKLGARPCLQDTSPETPR
jgi:hypothetical protein